MPLYIDTFVRYVMRQMYVTHLGNCFFNAFYMSKRTIHWIKLLNMMVC